MKLGGRIDISMVFLCIVKILSLLLIIPHDSYFVQVSRLATAGVRMASGTKEEYTSAYRAR